MKSRFLALVAIILLAAGAQAASLSENKRRADEVTQKRQQETKKTKEALRRDLARDRETKAKPLSRDRTVFRYTSKDRAKAELQKGIPPRSHMTASGGPGRPLSAKKAQDR